jgi:hypothetical protein
VSDTSKPRIIISVEYYAGGIADGWYEDERSTRLVETQPNNDKLAAFIATRLQAQAEMMCQGDL